MADEEQVALLKQGVKAWNKWRGDNLDIVPDLSLANLCHAVLHGANLRGADLCDADFSGAFLSGAKLDGADLRRANLRRAVLCDAILCDADLRSANLSLADLYDASLNRADLYGANLYGANLYDVDLHDADLRGVDLSGADLRRTTLIDSRLDNATLTDAKLWETQRGGWSIRNVTCHRAYWDRDGKKADEYEDGAFERIYAEKPRIVLRYPGGISPIDLAMLPLIVERLQAEHPGCVLHIRSVQDDGNGATVTITAEDLTGREDDAFKEQLAQIQIKLETKLECVIEERDYLRQRLERMSAEAISAAENPKRLPPQEFRVYQSSGQISFMTSIEGITMSSENYNNYGQAGAFGKKPHAHDMTLQQGQNQSSLDLTRLAKELAKLRTAMKEQAKDEPDQDEAIGAVAAAQKAAGQGDERTVLQNLKAVGQWTLEVAEKIGVVVAAEAIKRAML